jgi:SAM-dependent methyltransferase
MDLRLKFNEDVLNYDKMRPTYVKDLYDDVIRFAKLSDNKKTLEIGIGTGQATQPFLNTGCILTAIELGENMVEFTKEKFSKFDNFTVVNSDFETVTLENNNYDFIYSATAFHWIPEEVGYTKVFNLLKSGGVIALFWNHPNRVENELEIAIQKVYDKHRTLTRSAIHRFSEEKCLEITETIKKYGFIDVEYKLYHQTRIFNASQYMALLNTYSDHRARQEENRVILEKELSDVINRFGGKIDIQDTIDLYLARKP